MSHAAPFATRASVVLPVLLLVLALAAGGCGRQAERPNIVLVVLDTVRDDHTGPGGGQQLGLTPALDALAAESTVFTNAFSTAPWTPPSHASMFTGLVPSEHGCTHQHTRLDPTPTTLAEIMADEGYATAAFYSNPWLADRTTALLRGFDVRVEAPASAPPRPGIHRGDQGGIPTNRNVWQWLSEQPDGEPFFLFVNYLEAHHPYDPPPRFRNERLADRDPRDLITSEWVMEFQAILHPAAEVEWDRVRDFYAGDVNSADNLLAGLLNSLKRRGLMENTVLIVTSDHGEHLGEHDLIAHQFSVSEHLLSVPLVVRAPERLPAGERPDPVMLSDLFATILDFAGVEGRELPRFSHSLLEPPVEGGRPLLAEYARPSDHLLEALGRLNPDLPVESIGRAFRTLRLGDLRLTTASDGTVQLHDMAADPGQLHDLSGERPDDVTALRSLLDDMLTHRSIDAPEQVIDDATREQLRALGYVR